MSADKLVEKLHQTTDATVWAQEFCKLFTVYPNEQGEVQDKEGLMVGWFANAIGTGEDHAAAALHAKLAAAEAVIHKARAVDHDRWCGASQHPNSIGGDWCDCSIGELGSALADLDALTPTEKPGE